MLSLKKNNRGGAGIIITLLVLVLVGGAAWLWWTTQSVTYSTDTTIPGGSEVSEGDTIIIKDSATLTVDGDYTVDGTVACGNGPATIIVNGKLTVNGRLFCDRKESTADIGNGISLVVKNDIEFTQTSEVITNGHVQIVNDVAKILTSSDQIESLYDEAGEDTGDAQRIGPFVPVQSEDDVILPQPIEASTNIIDPSDSTLGQSHGSSIANLLIPKAHAQTQATDADGNPVPNTTVLRGKWIIGNPNPSFPTSLNIPTPPTNIKKIIINFDFGNNNSMSLNNWTLTGPNGHPGEAIVGTGCDVTGNPGHDAMRLRARAANITINNFTLHMGSGGTGGKAETSMDCDSANATGGVGGKAGNIKMEATENFNIAGTFTIHPGDGGDGGEAIAHGKDGEDACAGEKGGDATARGGAGGDNKKGLRVNGTIAGTDNIDIKTLRGGTGGLGTANGGDGGNGDECGCDGGQGGNAQATGGKGGDAISKKFESIGGNGGDASFFPGMGGTGGHCGPDATGGNGGKGGNVQTAETGKGGFGSTSNGQDGSSIDKTGGNGGNGGDGCVEGSGGEGGSGDPKGEKGEDGKNLCGTVATPTPPSTTGDVEITPKKIDFTYNHQTPQCPLPAGELNISAPNSSTFEFMFVSPDQPVWLNFPNGNNGPIDGPIPVEFPCLLDRYENQNLNTSFNVHVYDVNGNLIGEQTVDVDGKFTGF